MFSCKVIDTVAAAGTERETAPDWPTALGFQPQELNLMTEPHRMLFTVKLWIRVNDPSAGSPTETLLRLLLPLSDKVH
jgi:hypothetical protein